MVADQIVVPDEGVRAFHHQAVLPVARDSVARDVRRGQQNRKTGRVVVRDRVFRDARRGAVADGDARAPVFVNDVVTDERLGKCALDIQRVVVLREFGFFNDRRRGPAGDGRPGVADADERQAVLPVFDVGKEDARPGLSVSHGIEADEGVIVAQGRDPPGHDERFAPGLNFRSRLDGQQGFVLNDDVVFQHVGAGSGIPDGVGGDGARHGRRSRSDRYGLGSGRQALVSRGIHGGEPIVVGPGVGQGRIGVGKSVKLRPTGRRIAGKRRVRAVNAVARQIRRGGFSPAQRDGPVAAQRGDARRRVRRGGVERDGTDGVHPLCGVARVVPEVTRDDGFIDVVARNDFIHTVIAARFDFLHLNAPAVLADVEPGLHAGGALDHHLNLIPGFFRPSLGVLRQKRNDGGTFGLGKRRRRNGLDHVAKQIVVGAQKLDVAHVERRNDYRGDDADRIGGNAAFVLAHLVLAAPEEVAGFRVVHFDFRADGHLRVHHQKILVEIGDLAEDHGIDAEKGAQLFRRRFAEKFRIGKPRPFQQFVDFMELHVFKGPGTEMVVKSQPHGPGSLLASG